MAITGCSSYPNPAIRSSNTVRKGHCEYPQGARQSHGNGEIVTLPPALRSGLWLTATATALSLDFYGRKKRPICFLFFPGYAHAPAGRILGPEYSAFTLLFSTQMGLRRFVSLH